MISMISRIGSPQVLFKRLTQLSMLVAIGIVLADSALVFGGDVWQWAQVVGMGTLLLSVTSTVPYWAGDWLGELLVAVLIIKYRAKRATTGFFKRFLQRYDLVVASLLVRTQALPKAGLIWPQRPLYSPSAVPYLLYPLSCCLLA